MSGYVMSDLFVGEVLRTRRERREQAAAVGRLAFHATDLTDRDGFRRTIGSIGSRSFPVAHWRTAVVYPVLDHLLLPALPFPVTYERCRWVDGDTVTDVTVDGHPARDAEAAMRLLLPYWVSVHRSALSALADAALTRPAQDPGQRLWGALAGLGVAEITAMGPDVSPGSLKTLAGLTGEPLWQAHCDPASAD